MGITCKLTNALKIQRLDSFSKPEFIPVPKKLPNLLSPESFRDETYEKKERTYGTYHVVAVFKVPE